MAAIRDIAVTINATATASMACDMPTHVAGDLLVAFATKDAAATFTTVSAGWNAIRTVVSAGAGGGVYANRAATSSETLTLTLTSDQCNAVVLSISGVEAIVDSGAGALTISVVAAASTYTRSTGSFETDGFTAGQTVIMSGFTNAGNNGAKQITSITGVGTILTVTSIATLVDETGSGNERVISTGLDASAASGADDTSLPLTGIGLTPIANNCLILHGLHADIGAGISALPPWVNLFPQDDAACSTSVSYTFKPTAGAITAPDHWATIISGVDCRSTIIAVRDSGSDTRPPYIPLSTTPSTLISPLAGLDAVDAGAWVAGASIAITTVAGKTVTGVTVANTVDAGYNPFRASMTTAGASSTTNLAHTEFNLTTPINVTTLKGLIFGTYRTSLPRDYLDMGSPTNGGVYILAGSTTANYKAWVVGGQFDKETSPDRQNFLIEVANSDTIYASAGTADFTSTDYFAFGSSGYYGAASMRWSELYSINEVILAGGSSASPITFEEIIKTINFGAGNIPLLQQAGALATIWCPIRFGGAEAIDIDVDLSTFQFPHRADEVDYTHFHCAPDKIGVEFYGTGSGDTLSFTNCLFTSASSYYWRFNSSHSASTVIDFGGTTVVGANVTLRSTVTLDSTSFISCGTFTQNAATLTNCAFTNTKVTSASPGDADNISDSTFTKTTGTQHGIEISGTAADMTLDGVTFTGYASTNGSTGNEAIYVNIASGTMTISITGGGSIPSIRTAGATVTVQNAVTVKVTAKDATTLAAIDAARVLMEANSVATGTHTGANNASTLTDSSKSFTTNELVNYRIYNTTDGSDGPITANTATTVTATLSGGTENDWDTSDAYIIVAKPALNPVSITRSGATATVTHRNHGLSSGTSVVIRGATQDEYNGVFTISNVSTNAYDYTVSGSPATPATGSPTSTAVILNSTTDASGILQTTSFNFVINQPITGKVRKATAGTKYKTGTITGTIISAGLDTTTLLIVDE